MTKYRKKPVVVEAVQFTGTNASEIITFCGDHRIHSELCMQGDTQTHLLRILTLEGDMHISPGDWIIRGVAGEVYPCKPEIFSESYEEVGKDPLLDSARQGGADLTQYEDNG